MEADLIAKIKAIATKHKLEVEHEFVQTFLQTIIIKKLLVL